MSEIAAQLAEKLRQLPGVTRVTVRPVEYVEIFTHELDHRIVGEACRLMLEIYAEHPVIPIRWELVPDEDDA